MKRNVEGWETFQLPGALQKAVVHLNLMDCGYDFGDVDPKVEMLELIDDLDEYIENVSADETILIEALCNARDRLYDLRHDPVYPKDDPELNWRLTQVVRESAQ